MKRRILAGADTLKPGMGAVPQVALLIFEQRGPEKNTEQEVTASDLFSTNI